ISGGKIFEAMMLIISIIMALEWKGITSLRDDINKFKWEVLGIFYIFIPMFLTAELRDEYNGLEKIMYVFALVWATDTGAYFAGKTIGGPKILPKVSPKKTWAGLIGGIITALVISFVIKQYISEYSSIAFSYIVVPFISIFSQVGDFIESAVKRYFNVKDSGNLIPGHGGFLDRCDGMMFAVPLFYLLLNF
ncbi:MAG: phosphatidate cytidylyltransferase, partial [Alphaproteobacteria bacterium]|nr:phosphatidate cytidylyltransferase [Alphaproteobacteria bacterium]